jgi:lipid-binding SYLF domain-containing protein
MKKSFKRVLSLTAVSLLLAPSLFAEDMAVRIDRSIKTLDQKQHSDQPIPEALLEHAKGVAIFSLTKAGAIVGGRSGEGLVIVRTADGKWSAPSAFNIEGVSVGAQIGFTDVKYILILNTDAAVQHFTSSGKTAWDAAASVTVDTKSATGKLAIGDLEKADTVIYRDSNGAFVGATLGSTEIYRADSVNLKAYGENGELINILNGNIVAPSVAKPLYMLVAKS